MKFLICLASVLLLYLPNAWADCKSDCQDEYESAVNSCKEQYYDPDDADELQMCLDSAKGDYDTCIDECRDSTLTWRLFFLVSTKNDSPMISLLVVN